MKNLTNCKRSCSLNHNPLPVSNCSVDQVDMDIIFSHMIIIKNSRGLKKFLKIGMDTYLKVTGRVAELEPVPRAMKKA